MALTIKNLLKYRNLLNTILYWCVLHMYIYVVNMDDGIDQQQLLQTYFPDRLTHIFYFKGETVFTLKFDSVTISFDIFLYGSQTI